MVAAFVLIPNPGGGVLQALRTSVAHTSANFVLRVFSMVHSMTLKRSSKPLTFVMHFQHSGPCPPSCYSLLPHIFPPKTLVAHPPTSSLLCTRGAVDNVLPASPRLHIFLCKMLVGHPPTCLLLVHSSWSYVLIPDPGGGVLQPRAHMCIFVVSVFSMVHSVTSWRSSYATHLTAQWTLLSQLPHASHVPSENASRPPTHPHEFVVPPPGRAPVA